jgi:hypothetical protein
MFFFIAIWVTLFFPFSQSKILEYAKLHGTREAARVFRLKSHTSIVLWEKTEKKIKKQAGILVCLFHVFWVNTLCRQNVKTGGRKGGLE